MSEPGEARRGQVGALLHGLSILDLFSPDRQVIGVGEIARDLQLHKSSASRLAATLMTAGYLQPAGDQGTYRLAPKLLRLAALVSGDSVLPDIARPLMGEVVNRCGETGHAMVLDGTDVVTVVAIDGWRSVRMHTSVGKRSPAHASAGGKALLSGLDDSEIRRLYDARELTRCTATTCRDVDSLLAQVARVREFGVAYDHEELEADLTCVAVPVFDYSGGVVGAVGLSGPTSRLDEERVAKLEEELRRAGTEISTRLGRVAAAEAARPKIARAA